MNVLQDNIVQIKKNFITKKPMAVKRTVLGNALMPPPSNAVKKFATPSSSRSRPKDGLQSATSHTKSTPTVRRDSHVIVSICEGRGKATGIVGIAAVDIHRPVLILSQISDTQTYTTTLTKLNILRPVEVLVPATFIEGAAPSRLVTVIMDQFSNISVTSVPRSEFNRLRGIHTIQSICAPVFNSVILQINHKFYASAASSALLRYVEQSRRVLYSPKTVKVEFQEPEHTTAIDIDTADLLELVATTGKQNVSLFTVLDYCSTSCGKKLLRTCILQPPCHKNVIETRLDCVQELIENPNLLTRLQETLKPLSDIEASLTFGTVVPATASSVSERQLNYTLQLKGLLSAVQPLADELKATKHPVFKDIYNRIEGLDTRKKILALISEVVNEDAHLAKGQAGELQRCFAIRSGIHGFLDLARRLYTEGVDSMRSYVDELTASYNLPLRFQHTIKNGFHIILPLTKALSNLKKTDLPSVFIKVERFSNHFYLTTMDMINFDKRLKNNSTEIQNISNVIIYKLLVDITPYIGDLYQLCDDVAQLDMLVSLARASSIPHWVRPRLVDTHLNLEGARHPLLEHVADQEPVPNSVYAYPRSNLHIITGPNMSGKTILLHSLCLIQVLSQLGCFVPCSKATVRVSDKIFVRVADDGTSLTASSFALEMTKLSYLLATLTDRSLIVMDELCKTTATDEGVSIAMAVCEKIVNKGCFVFVASHFLSLTILADLYPSVANWHLETIEEQRANNTRISLKFTYRLLPGVTTVDSYGIKLSRIFSSSKSIADRADELYKYLLPMRKSLASESASKKPEYLKFKLQSELDLLKIRNQLTDEIQNDKITNFQNKTGLSFEPSPLTIARTNSNSMSLQRSSSNEDKKISSNSSSAEKKISSESWVPTPSNKSDGSSNHEFSVPSSNKTSLNKNQDKSINKHLFSFDVNDMSNQKNTEETHFYKSRNIPNFFAPDENLPLSDAAEKQTELNSFHSHNITFPEGENDKLSSIHKNISPSQDILPTASIPKANFLFYNSLHKETQSQDHDLMFPEPNDSSIYRNISQSDENHEKAKSPPYSQETNWSSAGNNQHEDRQSKSLSLIFSEPEELSSIHRNISQSDENNKKSKSPYSQETNWSSTINNQHKNKKYKSRSLIFPEPNELSSIHRNISQSDETHEKAKFPPYSQKTNWSSAGNNQHEDRQSKSHSLIFSEPNELSSIHRNISQSDENHKKSKSCYSQESNCSSVRNNDHKDKEYKSQSLIFPEPNELSSIHRNISQSDENSKKSKFSYSKRSNWSSAENTLINNNISRYENIIVNSTPSKSANSEQNINNKFLYTVQNHDVPKTPELSKNTTINSLKENYVGSQKNISSKNSSPVLRPETNTPIQVPKTPPLSKNVTLNSLEGNSVQSRGQHSISPTSSSPMFMSGTNSLIHFPKLNSTNENYVQSRSQQNISASNPIPTKWTNSEHNINNKFLTSVQIHDVPKTPILPKNTAINSFKENYAESQINISPKNSSPILRPETNSPIQVTKTPPLLKNVTLNSLEGNSVQSRGQHNISPTSSSPMFMSGTNSLIQFPKLNSTNENYVQSKSQQNISPKNFSPIIIPGTNSLNQVPKLNSVHSRSQQNISPNNSSPINISGTNSLIQFPKLNSTKEKYLQSTSQQNISSKNSSPIIKSGTNTQVPKLDSVHSRSQQNTSLKNSLPIIKSSTNSLIQFPKLNSTKEKYVQSTSPQNISSKNSSPIISGIKNLIKHPKLNSSEENSLQSIKQNISPKKSIVIPISDTNSSIQVLKSPSLMKKKTLNSLKESQRKENISQNTSSQVHLSPTNSSIPVTESMLELSSPILTKNNKIVENVPALISKQNQDIISSIPPQIRLVSNLYDNISDSENSDENEDSKSDDCIIVNDIIEDSLEISNLDELDFASYLNLRQGITSTPINKKENVIDPKNCYKASSPESDAPVEINESTEYFTSNSKENTKNTVLSSNTFGESPALKRKKSPQIPEFNKILANKLRKKSLLPMSSPSLMTSSSSFKTCMDSSSNISKCSTTVVIGQNHKNGAFVKFTPPIKDDQVYEQDTVIRLNRTKYLSQSSNNSD